MITYPLMDGRIPHPNHGDWPDTLDELPAAVWSRLALATNRAGDPWRTPVVATIGPGNVPNARTVVLRDVDAPRATLAFHTHRFAPKAAECRPGARITWVFYDPRAGVQLRATGHSDPVTAGARRWSAWEHLPDAQRMLYRLAERPGEPLPPGHQRAMPEPDPARAEERFVMVETRLETMQLLFLEPPVNRAARFAREGGTWRGCWVAP